MALSKPMETMATATAAAIGACTSSLILYPLDTLKTRMQSQSKESKADASDMSMKSLYKGIQYKATQSTMSKFFYFYAYTSLSNAVTGGDGKKLSTAMNLIVGYLAELMHLPLTLPIEVMVTKMQTTKGKINVMEIFKNILKEGNGTFAGFYKGFSSYFVLCLQPAIQFTVFEQVKAFYLKSAKKTGNGLTALEVRISLFFRYISCQIILIHIW